MTENDERIKKSYDKYHEVLVAHSSDHIKVTKKPEEETKAEKARSSIKELFNDPVSRSDLMKL